MRRGEPGRVAAGLLVHQVVDVALPVERDRPGAVPRHRLEAHGLEQRVQLLRLRMRVLDEAEAVRARGVLRGDPGGGRIVRKGTHVSFSRDRVVWCAAFGPVHGGCSASAPWRREALIGGGGVRPWRTLG
jgi:hypothetical protein